MTCTILILDGNQTSATAQRAWLCRTAAWGCHDGRYSSPFECGRITFMNVLHPWQLLLVALACWINRQQQDVISYVEEENRILKSKLKCKRIRFTDNERGRLDDLDVASDYVETRQRWEELEAARNTSRLSTPAGKNWTPRRPEAVFTEGVIRPSRTADATHKPGIASYSQMQFRGINERDAR